MRRALELALALVGLVGLSALLVKVALDPNVPELLLYVISAVIGVAMTFVVRAGLRLYFGP